jgi:tetratricopeptide (TPR) repeat protein
VITTALGNGKKVMKKTSTLAAGFAAISLALWGCGGSSKKGGTTSGVTGKPKDPSKLISGGSGKKVDPSKRVVSASGQKKFEEAAAYHRSKAKDGWSGSDCSSVGDRWASVASKFPKLVEARFNAGLAYQKCKKYKAAEKQFQMAAKRGHGGALSQLGSIYFRLGKKGAARKYWESAIKADSKLTAARVNLAWLLLQEFRGMKPYSGSWKAMQKQLKENLSSVLAVDQGNYKAHVLYGLVYMEGSERNKDRLGLAKLHLDEAKKRSKDYPPTHNAYGLLYMRQNALGYALQEFQKAVALDPNFVEARLNVGLLALGFRKYDTAFREFRAVLELNSKNYDALVGRGIAERGLAASQVVDQQIDAMRKALSDGKSEEDVARAFKIDIDSVRFWKSGALPSQRKPELLNKAEASYKAALKLDNQKGAAYFNLGVLYKDFRANKAGGLQGSVDMYKKALEYFRDFMSKKDATKADKAEAKDSIKDLEKIIKQLTAEIAKQKKSK